MWFLTRPAGSVAVLAACLVGVRVLAHLLPPERQPAEPDCSQAKLSRLRIEIIPRSHPPWCFEASASVNEDGFPVTRTSSSRKAAFDTAD
jgi:hypothetical protein